MENAETCKFGCNSVSVRMLAAPINPADINQIQGFHVHLWWFIYQNTRITCYLLEFCLNIVRILSVFIALVLIARTVISEWDGKVFCGYSAYCGTPSSINNCYKSNLQHTLTSNNLQKILVKQSSQVSTCMEYETHANNSML